MTLRSLALVCLLAVGVLLWVFNDDPEADVRSAHAALESLIDKDAPESAAAAAVLSLSLRDLFAAQVTVRGAAGGLAGVYTPEDLAGTIVRVRAAAQSVDVSFGELSISFPESDAALTEFSAELFAEIRTAGQTRTESRRVSSRMHDVDGRWLFTELEFAE